jgi:hypothetical protein
VVRPKDPNDSLEVTTFHLNHFDYSDFCFYARRYPGDPNYKAPAEPNIYDIIETLTDPNLIEAILKSLG